MTKESAYLLGTFPIRKSRQQKENFRSWLTTVLQSAGYAPQVSPKGILGSRNIIVGNPERAKVLFTAHYDTCAVLPFPNMITPENFLLYLLYQVFIALAACLLPFLVSIWAAILTAEPLVGTTVFLIGFIAVFWMLLAGRANRHNANDNTSGVVTLLEIALALPENEREKVCFVFFDNEEKGLLGSMSFQQAYGKALGKSGALVLNFDCVSDGDYILFFPKSRVRRDSTKMAALSAFQGEGEKRIVMGKRLSFYPSDQSNFRYGVGVAAFRRKKFVGYYLGRIHTGRDTVFDEKNIQVLCAGALRLAKQE